jgi:hypothetical protein
MAAQWLRWNLASHIFEYSTDNGASFLPLPLDASILTQGTLDPARIPGGGGGANANANNTWTGINTYAGISPLIRFSETDQGVNQKNWEIQVDGQNIYLARTLNDALGAPANLFWVDRTGNLNATVTGVGTHSFNSGADNYNVIHMVSSNPGVSTAAGVMMQNNLSDGRAYVVCTSSGNTNPSLLADALNLISSGLGGILVNAKASAPIVFKTTDTVRMTIAASGGITLNGAVTLNSTLSAQAITAVSLATTGNISAANITAASNITAAGGYYELGRATALGYWAAVAYSAAYFTTSTAAVWTVASGDMVTFAWNIVGKMMTVVVEILNSSISAAVGELRVTIPVGGVATRTMTTVGWSAGHSGDPAINTFCSVSVNAGTAYIAIKPTVPSTGAAANFNPIADGLDVRFQITFQIN